MQGFDFGFTPDGDLIIDGDTNDIYKVMDNNLKVQLTYNRVKSVSTTWFFDHVGADLEEIVGWKCNKETAEYGKTKIVNMLTFDDLWNKDDMFIKAEIKDHKLIIYSVFLKMYQQVTEETYSIEITIELDLVKGVKIRYGWNPYNNIPFGIDYKAL